MGVFDRQIASAKKLLSKNGELIEWSQYPTAVGAEPWEQQQSIEIKHAVVVVFIAIDEYLDVKFKTQSWSKLSDIPSGMVKGLLPVVNFRPTLSDLITRPSNGETYSILSIDELNLNGETIMWSILLKP